MIDAVADFISLTSSDNPITTYFQYPMPDYYYDAMNLFPFVFPNPGVPEGKMMDSPWPAPANMPRSDGLIVPKSFLLEDRDVSVPWMTAQGRFMAEGLTDGMYMLGGAMSHNHDGTTGTNSHYREGAFHCAFFPSGDPDFLEHRRTLFEHVYGDGTPTENLPPMSEYNHMNPQLHGPLKTNWSVPCPFLSDNFTSAQQDEFCVPILESIFGTEGLTKLERIKSDADPDHLFNSWGTVGYRNVTYSIAAPPPSSPSSTDPRMDDVSSPPETTTTADNGMENNDEAADDGSDDLTSDAPPAATHMLWIQASLFGLVLLNLFFCVA
jgi:hypothetical protein